MNNTSDLMNRIDFFINNNTNRYYNKDNISVPRVTDILSSMMHNDALMYWSNNLGLKGLHYKTELNRSALYGTQAHSYIERYLKEKIKTDDNIPFCGYLMWEEVLTKKGFNVIPIYVEHHLVCDWFGGTADAVLNINGRNFLIDFKTSNTVTYKYFLQLAAYKYMLEQQGVSIDGVIVLQLSKVNPGFNEYLLDFKYQDHINFINYCTEAFFSLVYAYYHIKRIEAEYNKIF